MEEDFGPDECQDKQQNPEGQSREDAVKTQEVEQLKRGTAIIFSDERRSESTGGIRVLDAERQNLLFRIDQELMYFMHNEDLEPLVEATEKRVSEILGQTHSWSFPSKVDVKESVYTQIHELTKSLDNNDLDNLLQAMKHLCSKGARGRKPLAPWLAHLSL